MKTIQLSPRHYIIFYELDLEDILLFASFLSLKFRDFALFEHFRF